MAHPRTKSTPRRRKALPASLARALAPEEVRPGDFVAVLYEIVEIPSWYLPQESSLVSRDDVVRIRTTPRADALPLKVVAVCLPFVLVKRPCGAERTLDVRIHRLARLDDDYAQQARRAYRAAKKKSRPCAD